MATNHLRGVGRSQRLVTQGSRGADQPPVAKDKVRTAGRGVEHQARTIEAVGARWRTLSGQRRADAETGTRRGKIPGLVADSCQVFSEDKARAEIDRLGAELIANAAGMPITLEATREFLRIVAKDLVYERYGWLRSWYLMHKCAFADDAQARFDQFIEKDGRARLKHDPVQGVDQSTLLPEPALDASWNSEPLFRGVHYTHVDGALGVTPTDRDGLQQGPIGDCYFDSTVAWFTDCFANSGQSFCQHAIRDNGDGTVSTTFYVQDYDGAPIFPVNVSVPTTLLTVNGKIFGLHDRGGQDLGPSLYEKLWAKFKGGYGAIAGGLPVDAMLAITGKPATLEPIFLDSDPNDVCKMIADAQKHGEVMCADSYAVDPSTHPSKDEASFADVRGLLTDHEYTVFGVVEHDGKKYIDLRNPWGHGEPTDDGGKAKDGKDEGRFLLPVEDFIKCFMGFAHGPTDLSPAIV